MKKKAVLITAAAVLAVLLVLFLPVPTGVYDDGGTRTYDALTYKIVKWHRLVAEENEDGNGGRTYTYEKTSVYPIPQNREKLDVLWEIEMSEDLRK